MKQRTSTLRIHHNNIKQAQQSQKSAENIENDKYRQ